MLPSNLYNLSKNLLMYFIRALVLFLLNFLCLFMAPHSSTLAWKIPWTEEPGGLQSIVLLGVRHDSATSLSLFAFMHWRRKWRPTPVFLPGESRGRRSQVGCCLWGHTESDMTEVTQQQQQTFLEEGMATHSSILAWRSPWTENLSRFVTHRVTKNQTQLR